MTDHQTARRLAALDQVLILTHRRPDGDTIGCAQRPVPGAPAAGKKPPGSCPMRTPTVFSPPIWRVSWPRRGFCPSMSWR